MESRMTKNKLQVVQFSCRNFNGCIDINYLCRIIALPLLTAAPEGPEYIIGFLNLHGAIIPVIDLSMRLKIARPLRYTVDTPILICMNSNRQQFGMIVDKVGEITIVDETMMQKSIIDTGHMPMINGTVRFNEQILLLINVDQLFDDDHTSNHDQRESE